MRGKCVVYMCVFKCALLASMCVFQWYACVSVCLGRFCNTTLLLSLAVVSVSRQVIASKVMNNVGALTKNVHSQI